MKPGSLFVVSILNTQISDRGFEIFKVFCKIDLDESSTLELEECMGFFGGKRTKFTERIFSVLASPNDDAPLGLDFRDFTYTVWNFCTLNVAGVARFSHSINLDLI